MAPACLAVFKLPPPEKEDPSYSSVAFDCEPPGLPAQNTAEVCTPKPAIACLAVLKLFCSDQLVPSYSSVSATAVVVYPPAINAAS